MKLKSSVFAAALMLMLLPILFACGGEQQPNPEDFGIEKFIEGHAKFVLCEFKDDQDFVKYAGDCLSEGFCTCNLPGTFVHVENSKTVKWQINQVITKSGWKKNEDAFLYPTPIDGNYPVFFIYTLDVDGEKTDYLLRTTQYPEDGNKWEVDLVMLPTQDQCACVTGEFKNNEWHTVTAE